MKKAEVKFKDTTIIEIQDDVFEFSINNAECGMYWIRSGFTGLSICWRAYILDKIGEHKITVINNDINKDISYDEFNSTSPWIFTHEKYRMYKISPKLNNLEYIYLFPNINDDLSNPNEVPDLINNALNEVNKHGIKSIAMNGIHSGRMHERDKHLDGIMAHEMMENIDIWLKNHVTSLDTIYLVNYTADGFGLSNYKTI